MLSLAAATRAGCWLDTKCPGAATHAPLSRAPFPAALTSSAPPLHFTAPPLLQVHYRESTTLAGGELGGALGGAPAGEHESSSESGDGGVSRRDTTMTFTTFVFFDLFNAMACKSSDQPVFLLDQGFFANQPFLVAVGGSILGQLAVIYWAPMQAVFQTEALSLNDLGFITALTSSMIVLDTARKIMARGSGSAGLKLPFASPPGKGSTGLSGAKSVASMV